MLEDAAAAVHTARQMATDYDFDPGKIGVVGSSAGGHLAASLMVHFGIFAESANCRPDFGILSYPVISFVETFKHQGSCDNLLGEGAPVTLRKALSAETQVKPDTPPCFLWHTAEDAGVPMENSFAYASALRREKIPCELHVYPHGAHGLGLGTSFRWEVLARQFVDRLFHT